jgi:hypothetical protein
MDNFTFLWLFYALTYIISESCCLACVRNHVHAMVLAHQQPWRSERMPLMAAVMCSVFCNQGNSNDSSARSDCTWKLLPLALWPNFTAEVNLINILSSDVSTMLTHNIILRPQWNFLRRLQTLPDAWSRPREINLQRDRIISGAVKSQWDSSFKATAANLTKPTNNWEN